LFPIIMVGMTAGAPLGSIVAARLFRLGIAPELILQISAVLLAASVAIYLKINSREEARSERRGRHAERRGETELADATLDRRGEPRMAVEEAQA